MNSFVNVQVRVLAGQAMAQLAALEARVSGLEGGFGKATRGSNLFGASLDGMRLDAFGSRIQWIGRQLEYNFTLPILAAAGASVKLALDNETAFKRIEKVYGDAAHGADQYSKELEALQRNFKALSNEYGVNQTEVLQVAAAWAAAGASGIALAKSVDLTMQTMILGEMKAAEATEALIAIQAQYGQNVGELTKTIATLNMVENQTGISLKGLVEGFARSAGIARSAGVDVRHLAAMLAALTPASGSAAQAGNALKTIFSRLLSPTKETVEVLKLMGIEYGSVAWKSATVTQQLNILAKSFEDLSDKQKGVVSSVVASRWQVNRFDVLMRELINTNGYYQKALEGTRRETDLFAQMSKELNTVLSSNPRRLQIMWTILQNAAADIVQPLIPMLLWLATAVAKVTTAFSELDPGVQKLILGLLIFLATIGPIVRIGGALVLMFAQVAVGAKMLLAPIALLGGALYKITKTPIISFFGTLGRVMGGGLFAATNMATRIIQAFGVFMSKQILLIAAQIGISFGMGMKAIPAITAGVLVHIVTMWKTMMSTLQAIMIAGAAALGRAWRAALAGLAAMQKAWAAFMAINWRTVFMFLVTTAAAGFRGIGKIFVNGLAMLRAASLAIAAALTGPWGAAIALVVALVFAFWDELKQLWSTLVRGTISAFNQLPAGIRNAFVAVVTIIQRAVMAIYDAFSWMNPWARHSPSLVENVTTGVAEIKKQYSSLDEMNAIFHSVGMSMHEVGEAVKELRRAAQIQEFDNNRKEIEEYASSSIPLFDKLVKVIFPLQDLLDKIGDEVAAQQSVVDGWKAKLDAANDSLEAQEKILKQLQDTAQGYKDQLEAAQAELDRYANAPIEGMKAMEDAIFANEMQQKALRLEMLKMEEAVGPLDELQGKIDSINGQMELLSGEQANLRNAGAGGEILRQYDQQIDALDQQKKVIEEQIKPIQDLADQIEDLGREAEKLDLEQSLKFDPLKKQIDDLINSMDEMPFDEILNGVTKNKAEVDRLTQAYNEASEAVKAQQAIVDQFTASRDAIQASYDLENEKLQLLKDEYDQVETKVREIESALQDMASAARAAGDAARDSMSPGAENFLASAGGNFPDPGGFAQIGREGGFEDQSKLIDDFTKEMADKTKNMFGAFSFLDPIKNAWNTAWGWVKDNVGAPVGDIVNSIKTKLGENNPFGSMGSWLDTAREIWDGIKQALAAVWEVIGPEVIEVAKQAWAGLQDAFKDIQPEIEKFRDLVGPMGEALGNLWKILKPVLAVVLGLILMVIKALLGALAGAIGPFIRGIGDLIAGVVKILRGIIEFIVGVFTGDWERAWNGIKDIFSGIWQAVWGVLKNFVNMIWGAIKGFVKAIWDFFVWLWDELVGHSIIPDMVNAIIDWFKNLVKWGLDLIKAIVDGIVDLWKKGWDWVEGRIEDARDGILFILNAMKTGFLAIWNGIKDGLKSAWDWVWNQIKDKIDWAKGVIDTAIRGIKSIFEGLATSWRGVVDTLKRWIDDMIAKFNSIRDRFSFGGLFDGMKSAFKSAINWIIRQWNDFSLTLGGGSVLGMNIPSVTLETPNISYLAKGGMIARKAMAVIGEGRAGYPEYVIPTDPLHRRRAMALFNQLGGELGSGVGKGMVYAPNHTENRTIHFHGDLEFPNIKDGSDAEEFLRNLEALINEAS